MKRGKKALAVLSTAALFGTTPAAVTLPFLTATVAHAAGTATALVVPNINSSAQIADLGTIDLFIPKGALASGSDNQVTLLLPNGFQFDPAVIGSDWTEADVTQGVSAANVSVAALPGGTTPSTISYNEQMNNNVSYGITVAPVNNSRPMTAQDNVTKRVAAPYVDLATTSGVFSGTVGVEWQIPSATLLKIKFNPQPGWSQIDDVHLLVHLPNINVTGPSDGPVNATLIAPSNSALPTGTVTVANVVSSGKVDLAATDTQSSSDEFTFNLAVNEEVAGSLKTSTNALKLKLPSGFKWYTDSQNAPAALVYGQDAKAKTNLQIHVQDQDLWISTTDSTTQASGWLITGLHFYVDDETVARNGDVTVQITGASSTNVSSLVVGHYGQVGFESSVVSKPTLIAGKKEQIIGDIIIKETVPGSFIDGRTVTLQLPDGARWETPFENSKDAQNGNYVGSITATNGLGTPKVVYTDTDRRTLKLIVNGNSNKNSTNPGEIDLRNMQVALQPGFSGDLTIQLGGSEGVTGNITVATVQTPISVKADTTPNVIVGAGGQAIGTITLTENVAGGFAKNSDVGSGYNQVHIELPYGVQFDGTPTVEVTQGDLRIKDVSSGLGSNNKGYLDFYVDAESTTPSQITISNAKLKLDRTVPQGDIVLKVKGPAVSYTAYAKDANPDLNSPFAVQTWQDNNTTAASTTIATVTTPAQSGSNVATFTVGSTTYTVNGQQQTMDVAPYLKNDGRVMLPVRFVANALGVSDDSIIWNQNDKSVTIFKGGSVVKMTLGSNTLIVNGTAVQMDVAPELYNDGRVMLPIRWVGQALNANISWDQATQTVTVTTQQ
ncbi:copper amine oxidase N-terminal domain-containing protein [Kyrpidia tusciae]|uniref:Copper amine oxidase domain protein n=1 Tax=Kyrpidia tusciae (strain DSM 2912 / NBRC 15312 / T2) TaxID=562970 RepID=D5WWL6_KYRT2|nr:copper amine oxidase N-terminal domain-containing protein [Kyrpidia tusciae]ADG07781.1 copper amine oxidase domain protein [Kyrpidia tusciae DSM 2912]